MQRILSLVWFKIYPAHFGGQKGIAGFNHELSKHFALTCLCSRDNDASAETAFPVIAGLPAGKKQFLSPGAWRQLRRHLQRLKPHWLLVEFPYYFFAAWVLRPGGTGIILHLHNLEGRRFQSFGNRGWQLLARYEKWCIRHADLVLFKTAEDRDQVLQMKLTDPAKTYLLPYGIRQEKPGDKKAARSVLEMKHGLNVDTWILLFNGTLDYAPNAAAVEFIYGELAPALEKKGLDFKILICGRNESDEYSYLKKLHHQHIIQAGFVTDIEIYLLGSDLFVNPVRNVHGIQTKIADALAHELPVVCYETAARPFPGSLIENGLFPVAADDAGSFTTTVERLRKATFVLPPDFWEVFGWEGIVARFARFLHQYKP